MGEVVSPPPDGAQQTREVLRLFELHGPDVYRTAYGILGSEADAQDAAQDVFLYLLRKPSSLRKVASVRAWLCRAAANAAVTIRRSQAGRRRREAAVQQGRKREMDQGEGQRGELELKEHLRRHVAELPEKLRLAIVLHYFQGLPCREVAEAIPCTLSAASTRLDRARARLRDRLTRSGFPAAVPLGEALSGLSKTMPGHVSEAVASTLRSPSLAPPPRWSPPSRLPLPVAAGTAAGLVLIVAGAVLLPRAIPRRPAPGDLGGPPGGSTVEVASKAGSEATTGAGESEDRPLASPGESEEDARRAAAPAVVHGFVVAEKGESIPDVSVEVAWRTVNGLVEQKPEGTAVRSDSQGRFVMPPSGYPLMLRTSHRDYAPGEALVASPSPVRFVLEKGIRHAGTVLDAATGDPIEGAKVKFGLGSTGPFDLGFISVEALTGADGRFEAPPLPVGEGSFWATIAVQHPDYLMVQGSKDCEILCSHEIRMVSPSSHRLVVSVLAPDGGAAPPGTTVSVISPGGWRSYGDTQWTGAIDSRGEARFEDLGPSWVEIWADGPGYARGRADVEIRKGDNRATVTLADGETVTGRVVFKDSGRALENVPVALYVVGGGQRGVDLDDFEEELRDRLRQGPFSAGPNSATTTTDAEGRFTFRVPRGGRTAYSVQVNDPEGLYQSFQVPEAGTGEWVLEILDRGEREPFSGRVTDSEGRPIPGAILLSGGWGTSMGFPDASAATTNAEGMFRLSVWPLGDHVSIRAEGFVDRGINPAIDYPLVEGLPEIRLARRILIRGSVIPRPEPGEDLAVFLLGSDGGMAPRAPVDADGRFTLALSEDAEGRLAVNDRHLDHSWETDVMVPTATDEVVLRWRTGPGPARGGVVFHITDAETGQPVHGCSVWIQAGNDPASGKAFGASTWDVPGVASHGGIPAGTASVSFTAEGYLEKEIPIEVVADRSREYRVTLEPAPALAKGDGPGTKGEDEEGGFPPGEGVGGEEIGDLAEAIRTGNETAAIGSLRTIAAVQAQFREGNRDGDSRLDYARSLGELAEVGLIDKVLASGTKSGYIFTLSGSWNEWTASATPISEETGTRNFIICTDGVVRFASGGPADCSSAAVRQ